jgi:uncharacterized membrane protein (DUF373 family)
VAEQNVTNRFNRYFASAETVAYIVTAALLIVTAFGALVVAGELLWENLGHWHFTEGMLPALSQLLIALMLIEILHSVRISIRSHELLIEPFLIVGIIASVRRMLVISLEMASRSEENRLSGQGEAIFRHSMTELGVLGALILALVIAVALVRRYAPELAKPAEDAEPLSPGT